MAGLDGRGLSDAQTQAYVDYFRDLAQAADTQSKTGYAWEQSKLARLAPENYNDIPLRNAEHYLWTKHQPTASLMAPGYLIYKMLRSFEPGVSGDPERNPKDQSWQDPIGELLWGTKALFERPEKPK